MTLVQMVKKAIHKYQLKKEVGELSVKMKELDASSGILLFTNFCKENALSVLDQAEVMDTLVKRYSLLTKENEKEFKDFIRSSPMKTFIKEIPL